MRSLSGVSLALLLAVSLGACHATPFHAPAQPDLYKVPYDFGLAGSVPDADLAAADLAAQPEEHADLSSHHDDLGKEHD